MQTEFKKITLPELQYGYNALEPILVGEILQIHHQKHHQAYVNAYNAGVEELITNYYKGDTVGVQKMCKAVNFTAGGHNCHAWYWENLAPADNGGGILPESSSAFSKSIEAHFGSFDNFITLFNAKTAKIQGSGWGWLGYNPDTKALSIEETTNQDMIVTNGLVPLLTVDVWEHAYYLQYKNLRPDYLKNIWQVINWRCVENRFNAATNQQIKRVKWNT